MWGVGHVLPTPRLTFSGQGVGALAGAPPEISTIWGVEVLREALVALPVLQISCWGTAPNIGSVGDRLLVPPQSQDTPVTHAQRNMPWESYILRRR